jgi:hypothetical protein
MYVCMSVEHTYVENLALKVPVVMEILAKQYGGHFFWDTLYITVALRVVHHIGTLSYNLCFL